MMRIVEQRFGSRRFHEFLLSGQGGSELQWLPYAMQESGLRQDLPECQRTEHP